MFKQVTFLICGIILATMVGTVQAEYKKIKVLGQVETKITKTATTNQKKRALEDARTKALNKYIGGLDSQRVRILNNIIDQLKNNITVYVPDVVALDDGSWSNGYWTIGVEASINEAQIEEIINQNIQSASKKKGEEIYLSFIFVARETDSIRKFEDKKTERASESEAVNVSESEDGLSGQNERVMEKTSGGSTEKKADKFSYRSYIPEDIGSKVSEVFNKAEYSVVEPFEADIDTKSFISDFVEGDEISDVTKKTATSAARSAGLNYLAVATLDVGEQMVDQATGMKKVYVRVNGYIWDLKGKFVRKVCSVGPVQYSGLGEDSKVAKTNALINAASSAAKDLVDQLRLKQSR